MISQGNIVGIEFSGSRVRKFGIEPVFYVVIIIFLFMLFC